MTDLSAFQKDLRAKLGNYLASNGMALANERIDGEHTTYIAADVQSTDLKIWIYQDGAEFTNLDDVDCRFESVDFDSSELLIEEFIKKLNERIASH